MEFNYCINKAVSIISNLVSYCHETNDVEAPHVHDKPITYRDRKGQTNLKTYGAAINQGDFFSRFFTEAGRSRRNVRVGIFATCDNNALNMRNGLVGSVWVLVLMEDGDGRMSIMIFDPRAGVPQSKTRKLARSREDAVEAYKVYSKGPNARRMWHNRDAAAGDPIQAVVGFVRAIVIAGDKCLGEDDDRLASFVVL
jgi:hypothetical protein